MFTNSFDKQLDKTLKIGAQHTREREKLKEMFCNEYDNISVNTLLESLQSKGHPSEKRFAINFKVHYESDNYDEQEIGEFKRLFVKYKKDVIATIEQTED